MSVTGQAAVAIIGGTGVGEIEMEGDIESVSLQTPWGDAAARVGTLRGCRTVFLARHGAGHRMPPHRINYRANIAALQMLGVRAVYATTAVGGLRTDLAAGDLVLLNDFIDFTRMDRGGTFFDEPGQVVHTDFSEPYSHQLRNLIKDSAQFLNIDIHPEGTYVCTDGPRYESPAEVRMFASWGGDVVGMTGVPEATLAREAGLHYAGISLVTNAGSGLTETPLSHGDVTERMREAGPRLRELLAEAIARIDLNDLPPVGPGANALASHHDTYFA